MLEMLDGEVEVDESYFNYQTPIEFEAKNGYNY
jgi:hypothetical protein